MKKILVVDDNEQNLYMLQVLLSANGFQVEQASNGAEALECARRELPDMIVSDILMPVMDGYALCRAWKEDERLKNIPFIFYSATYTEPKDQEFALNLGADRFILKPTEPDKFLAMLLETEKDYKAGKLVSPRQPIEAAEYYKEYNAALVRKLEAKMLQLEKANRALEGDITERIRADQELRFRNTILSTQQEVSIDGILVVDEGGKIISYNRRFIDMWPIPSDVIETTSDDLALQSVFDKLSDPDKFIRKVKYLYEHHQETSRDEIALKDGKMFDRYSAPMVDSDGKYYGRVWYFRDITDKKNAEIEKEHLLAQLLQAQKMEAIGTLAGGVAHDFNNLLCAISGYTTLAMGKINESDPVQSDLKQVSFAAEKAAGVVRQLLFFSRKQHMEQMPMDVNTTISRLLKMLERLIGEDIVIESSLEKGIWNILGDEGNIEQMLMNLTVNARDAMPEGGKIFMKTENVTIDDEYCRTNKTARPGRFVCISVSDTGTGMDELTQQHIFEPFFTTKPQGKGTGLGLSVVFGIVQQHKGWINVYSEPGHGTTFSVYFPASSASLEQQSKEKASPASLEGKGKRIMVVEDQAEVRAIAKEILLTYGYSVFPVSSAKEAMKLFEKENGRIDLVFSDVVLPDMSGILLVQELLKRWNFKVIITSGYTDEKAHWDFIKENNYRFLHKPYAVRDFLQAVREVLEKK